MNYMRIDECSISNGLGIRTVLWVSGCSHHCLNCQNPETWDADNGNLFDETAFEKLCTFLSMSFIDGITYSGGDPLYSTNRHTIKSISEKIHNQFPNKNQWLYTGYTWEEIIAEPDLLNSISYIDFLVDGCFVENKKNTILAFRGSSNQRIIDVQKTLYTNEIVLFTNQHRKDGVI